MDFEEAMKKAEETGDLSLIAMFIMADNSRKAVVVLEGLEKRVKALETIVHANLS